MAEKVRFLVGSVLDAATVSACTACVGLPKENVQSVNLAKVYRATGHTHQWLRFDAGAATTANAVFVAGHNLSPSATVLVQAHTTSAFTGASLSYTFAMPTDTLGNGLTKLFHCWATNQSYRFWRLHIQDASGPTCSEIGRVMVGRYTEPTRNIRERFDLRWNDPSTGIQTMGRQAYYTLRDLRAAVTYETADAPEAQADQLAGIYAEVGRRTPFVLALEPTTQPHHHTFYVQFVDDLRQQHGMERRSNLGPVMLEEAT